jgi:hypothetical protein
MAPVAGHVGAVAPLVGRFNQLVDNPVVTADIQPHG